MEGGNYIVSWCFGHLVELADASSYNERYAKWRYDDLPIVPESWMFEVTKDKAQQFKVLSALMKDKRVTELVCATDAGREGELIFRLVYVLPAGLQQSRMHQALQASVDQLVGGLRHPRRLQPSPGRQGI